MPVGAPRNICNPGAPYASILRMNADGSGRETFASGWLQGESARGRPADVLVLSDGSLLVADDHAGAIYRITWRQP